jgi:hypothetical protein
MTVLVLLTGCRPLWGGSGSVELQGTLLLSDRGCLVMQHGKIGHLLVMPDLSVTPAEDGTVSLPDGQVVRVGQVVSTPGGSWYLGDKPEGPAIAARCGVSPKTEVWTPSEY